MKLKLLLIVCILLLLVSCAAHQPYPASGEPDFWLGLWHGFISPITFFISLFSHEGIRIYAYPNCGGWYDFGFMIGISGFSGGVFYSRGKK